MARVGAQIRGVLVFGRVSQIVARQRIVRNAGIDCVQAQAVVALSPHIADARVPVEHERVNTASLERPGSRQTGRAAYNHNSSVHSSYSLNVRSDAGNGCRWQAGLGMATSAGRAGGMIPPATTAHQTGYALSVPVASAGRS